MDPRLGKEWLIRRSHWHPGEGGWSIALIEVSGKGPPDLYQGFAPEYDICY